MHRRLCLLLAACSPVTESEVSLEETTAAGLVETLLPAGVGSAALTQPLAAVVGGEGLSVWTDAGAAPRSSLAHEVHAAAWHGGGLLVATAEGVLHGDEVMGPSGLAEGLTLPISRMQQDGDDLWIGAADGVYVLRQGWLHAVRVEEAAIRGPWVVHQGDLWVARAEELVVVEPDGRVTAVHPYIALDLAITDGALWARTDDSLLRWTDAWTRVPMEGTAMKAGGDAVWVVGQGMSRVPAGLDGAITTIEHDGTLLDVDAAGRAWTLSDGALQRVDLEPRGLWVVPDGVLTEAVELPLSLSIPVDVEEVSVTLDDVAVEVLDDPWRVAIDPAGLTEGPHTLVAEVRWTGGHAATITGTVTAPAITTATWADHVEPMAVRRCSVCHDGGTETVLHGRDLWVERFEDVLAEVEAARMPLGGELTASEIDMLRLWRDGGFE